MENSPFEHFNMTREGLNGIDIFKMVGEHYGKNSI